ncbi:MAG: tRNA (N6-isopentenyl adenosine(37)-C2)-methylthiotransferase MiaB [Saprospiraceae bacterium]|nr:tRNA (N6-isopentenyl adenosine(37)-C2)-methylthiotransferase MiaB [Saprospiraceae bacterium]MBK9629779.1 tRNA (N6-isopentenyl adenosine(37)-C2)-methylthiotransferase MiaB [Saprospiraceae bacterium]
MLYKIEDQATSKMDESRQGEALFLERKGQALGKFYYIESYGCQMNFSDSEIVASVLSDEGLSSTRNILEADFVFLNTCSIREKAEETVRKRLKEIAALKKSKKDLMVGVLGCMAERLKSKFLEEEKLVDIVVGPDAYRDLPRLIQIAEEGDKGVNVFLSKEETYADIAPLRFDSNGVSAYISIMRGCDNMCSFCVVPYTRGRERSRDPFSIVAEAHDLFNNGYREVTLLGQNVDSYKWQNPESETWVRFSDLLVLVAEVNPLLRIRFSTSHPKDITDEVLRTMASYPNICKYIHLPVQSGSSRILSLMNRTYDREWYIERINSIKSIIPDCAISSDIITGFCTEDEKDHQDTLSMMQYVEYCMSYMFFYSERPGTPAARKLKDDIPEAIKKERLNEIIRLQHQLSYQHNQKDIGKTFEVLIEGNSKRSDQMFKGRNSQNKKVIFPKEHGLKPGDYVLVKIESASSATLTGIIDN